MHCLIAAQALAAAIRPSIAARVSHRYFSVSYTVREQRNRSDDAYVDVENLLSKPTWSVTSLLPPKDQSGEKPEITPKQLHHLLRLSALPPPKDAEEEARMLSTLSSQLHFVKQIQKVDTSGIEPLRSLRDETAEGEQAAELGMDALKDALAREEVRGKFHRRIRRRREEAVEKQEEDWDPFQTAGKKVGRYFVVEGGKEK